MWPGVSTRSVDDLVAALGAESGISKSEVSRICAELDETVEAFRSRRLDHIEFPYVYLDATYLNVRNSVAQPVLLDEAIEVALTAWAMCAISWMPMGLPLSSRRL